MKRYWYKFRVKYGKTLDTGKNKKVSEEYLVEAIGTNHKLLARQDLSLVDKRLRTVAGESEVDSNLLVAVF